MSEWFSYFSKYLGKKRFKRILDSGRIKKKRTLLESDFAKIFFSVLDVKRDDLQEVLSGFSPPSFKALKDDLQKEIRVHKSVEELSPRLFSQLYKILAYPFIDSEDRDLLEDDLETFWHRAVEEVTPDIYWKVKQHLCMADEMRKLELHYYYERLICYYAELEGFGIGSYVPAPSLYPNCFYRVAGELLTGGGQLGFFLVPATQQMKILPIRLTRGTPINPIKPDYISHAITDVEPKIGKRGYESGLPYQKMIDKLFPGNFIEVGFSIGGTIVQWRMAERPEEIPVAWLFKSPGVPEEVWERFNQNVSKKKHSMEIHILRAKRDLVAYAGEHCLGYEAPEFVKVYLYLLQIPRMNVHLYDVEDPIKAKIEKIEGKEANSFLSNQQRRFVEEGRKKIGQHFLLPLLQKIKELFPFYAKKPIVHKIGFWFEARDSDGVYTAVKRYTYK